MKSCNSLSTAPNDNGTISLHSHPNQSILSHQTKTAVFNFKTSFPAHPLPYPTPSSSTFSAKPISQISLTTSLRASSPQKYVYPDPIPEFAEAVSTYISLRVCVNVGDIEFIYMHASFLGLPISQLAYLCDCNTFYPLLIT